MTDTATCGLCGERMTVDEIFPHLHQEHGLEVELQTWPDGDPVVVDATLEPGDFTR